MRPVGSSGSSGGSGSGLGVPHSGVVVTTERGDKYLVHKGEGYGYKGINFNYLFLYLWICCGNNWNDSKVIKQNNFK